MKVRCGFVSNSSTSSFSVFGVETSEDELIKVFFNDTDIHVKEPGCEHEFDREKQKFCAECGKPAWNEYDKDFEYEDFEEACSEKGLSYRPIPESDEIYVGWNLAGNGGKRAAKKQLDELNRINEVLKEIFGREGDFYSGSYYC